ncbi:hypothetical protein GCM10010967_23490 [Dyadobacter beijingensis]|uniref:Mannan endo-1,4-beta-mannosidase n=1 Tax=Dyadobacter beijingensis TaxID=365489 RepID=A0ABQ2HTX6_9BACT|nr:hypothetical protein [Dyadobacter beijingensis]GGM89917.1 hypothetical protein GCM10010967_23490 [Dyadobacter beijingensis]
MNFQFSNKDRPPASAPLPWILVNQNSAYFQDENGENWHPIGQNDAITWPDFQGLFQRSNVGEVEGHMAWLASHGVTCIRMMMEYCQTEHRYLEKPVGRFQPNMVQFWDDLFALCEKYKIRLLLTPFDTFWMARRWKFHPYSQLSGGPCKSKRQWLSCPEMLNAVKKRFTFFIERWGGSGALFGWDLWNEISPLHAGGNMEELTRYIAEISAHIRKKEVQLYRKSHPQTVSVFAPILNRHDMNALVFQHPLLDFASTHFYHAGTIDYPKNTSSAALITARMVREALELVPPGRPFFDSEHGPIAYFRRNKRGLPEAFDDAYFLHMQWAHFASGAAGGGMRWPYRYPHVLTHGMRRAQRNLSEFTAFIDWGNFKRVNLNEEILCDPPAANVFGCGDANQAIVWILLTENKKARKKPQKQYVNIAIPRLGNGIYQALFWDTETGALRRENFVKSGDHLHIECAMAKGNIAIAVGRCPAAELLP